MKLTEEQAFEVFDKILNWLGMEVTDDKEGIGVISRQERADFVMIELINLELN